MDPNEYANTMRAAGYVPDGKGWVHHSRLANKGQNPVVQKQPDDHQAVTESGEDRDGAGEFQSVGGGGDGMDEEADPAYNQAGVSEPDGSDDCQHRVTITVRFSNRIRTDLSGKLDTILDCIVRARRRLLDKITGNSHSSGAVRTRKRGGDNRDNKAEVSKVPF